MKRLELFIEGRRVRWYEAGSGPPVLLVHGAGCTGRLWARVMGLMSARFRVIAPDLPGFGGSEFYEAAAGPEGYAGFLAGFITALGLGRVSVAGSSMGGRAACILAAKHPEMLARLVLLSPSGLDMPKPEMLSELIKKAYSGRDRSGEAAKAAATTRELYGHGGLGPLPDGVLERITAPTLILWGGDDFLIPPSNSKLFGDAIKGSLAVTIKGAGHLLYTEKPEETASITIKFMDGLFYT